VDVDEIDEFKYEMACEMWHYLHESKKIKQLTLEESINRKKTQ